MSDKQAIQCPPDLVELGHIVSAYGIQGWIKVQPYSTHAEVLLNAKEWWLKAPVPVQGAGAFSCATPYNVVASRPQGATIVAQLKQVPDRTAAESMKGHTVWAARSSFPKASADEYYWVDLIGCRLFGQHEGQSTLIGEIIEVFDNGAHAVLRVARGSVDEQGQFIALKDEKGRTVDMLVPFVTAHILSVDIDRRRLESNWPLDF